MKGPAAPKRNKKRWIVIMIRGVFPEMADSHCPKQRFGLEPEAGQIEASLEVVIHDKDVKPKEDVQAAGGMDEDEEKLFHRDRGIRERRGKRAGPTGLAVRAPRAQRPRQGPKGHGPALLPRQG